MELEMLKDKYSVLEEQLNRLLSAFAALSKRIGQDEELVSASTDPKSTIDHMSEAASTAGEAVRNTIGSTFEETLDNVQDKVGDVGTTLSGTFDDLKETARDAFEDAKETTGDLRDMLERGVDKTTSAVSGMLQKADAEAEDEEAQDDEEEYEEEMREETVGGKRKKTRKTGSRKSKKKTRKTKKGRGKRR